MCLWLTRTGDVGAAQQAGLQQQQSWHRNLKGFYFATGHNSSCSWACFKGEPEFGSSRVKSWWEILLLIKKKITCKTLSWKKKIISFIPQLKAWRLLQVLVCYCKSKSYTLEQWDPLTQAVHLAQSLNTNFLINWQNTYIFLGRISQINCVAFTYIYLILFKLLRSSSEPSKTGCFMLHYSLAPKVSSPSFAWQLFIWSLVDEDQLLLLKACNWCLLLFHHYFKKKKNLTTATPIYSSCFEKGALMSCQPSACSLVKLCIC